MKSRRIARSTAALCATALAVGLALEAGGAAPAPTSAPREILGKTVERVLAVLADDALTEEQRRARIEEIAHERFDFRTMSRLVLARDWKRLSETQKEEFQREFTRFLANDYGDRIERYEQERVEILSDRAEPRGDVTVLTRIAGGEYDGALVDYRLRQSGEDWLVIDVVIEGVSLVSNFRDQFREIMSRGGPDQLLVKLREKNGPAAAELAE